MLWNRGVRKYERNSLLNTQDQRRRTRRTCSRCWSWNSLTARKRGPWWSKLSPCSMWYTTLKQISTGHAMENPKLEPMMVQAPGRNYSHGEEPTQELRVLFWWTAAHGRSCWRSLLSFLSFFLYLSIFVGGKSHSRWRVWGVRSSRGEVLWVDCNTHSLFPCATQGGWRKRQRSWEWKSKVEPGKRRGMWVRWFWLCFSLSPS